MSRRSKPWAGVIPDVEEQTLPWRRQDRQAREERREAAETRAIQTRIAQLQASGKPVDLSKLAATPGEITADAMAAMAAHDRADAARERREAEDRATRRQEQREAALTAEHARLVATGDYEAASAVFERLLAV